MCGTLRVREKPRDAVEASKGEVGPFERPLQWAVESERRVRRQRGRHEGADLFPGAREEPAGAGGPSHRGFFFRFLE